MFNIWMASYFSYAESNMLAIVICEWIDFFSMNW